MDYNFDYNLQRQIILYGNDNETNYTSALQKTETGTSGNLARFRSTSINVIMASRK